jgi:16S rRNA (cytosine967-C5)-methyltransferase
MSARDHALFLIDARELPGWKTILRNRRQRAPADLRDLALAEQISVGVVKNLLHLHFLIEHLSGRRLASVDPLVQKILAIALYQLRFLDRVPAHAAVDEAVEQAKRFGQRRAAGFVNAILRKAAAGNWPAPPDPDGDPAGHAEVALSCPLALYSRLAQMLGAEEALRQCRHNNAEPPLIVRLNAGRSIDEIAEASLAARPHERPGMVVLDSPPVRVLAELAERGIAQVQDPTAAAVVPLLELAPGQTVLDRCCGVGTKTMQLAGAVGPAGLVVAMDPSEARCGILTHLVEKRGLAHVRVFRCGKVAELPPDPPTQFDAMLVDVPCSNSGVLARRPEARYKQTPGHIGSLTRLQDEILQDSAARLRPGGRLVYSTCSIWPAENGERMAGFLSRHPDYRMLHEQTVLPSTDADPTRYHDGGYHAVLARD